MNCLPLSPVVISYAEPLPTYLPTYCAQHCSAELVYRRYGFGFHIIYVNQTNLQCYAGLVGSGFPFKVAYAMAAEDKGELFILLFIIFTLFLLSKTVRCL